MTVRLGLGGLVALAAIVAPDTRPARAEPDTPARAQAAARFRQGQAYFQRQDYDRAIAEYQAAFDLSGEPSLIFNIALCYDRTDRPEPALQAFRRYLELAPDGTISEEARNDVARLVPIVEKRAADRAAHEQAARREAAARDEAVARRVRVARYVIVAGAAVAVTGATFHVLASRTRGRLSREPGPDAYLADRHTFEIRRDVAIGGYAAGALTIATGLVLAHFADERSDGPRLSAAITPRGATMMVGWSR
jgi:tetratricopeptide (TPR) repeat protein